MLRARLDSCIIPALGTKFQKFCASDSNLSNDGIEQVSPTNHSVPVSITLKPQIQVVEVRVNVGANESRFLRSCGPPASRSSWARVSSLKMSENGYSRSSVLRLDNRVGDRRLRHSDNTHLVRHLAFFPGHHRINTLCRQLVQDVARLNGTGVDA